MSFLEGYIVGRVVSGNQYRGPGSYYSKSTGSKFAINLGGIMLGLGGLLMIATDYTEGGLVLFVLGLIIGVAGATGK